MLKHIIAVLVYLVFSVFSSTTCDATVLVDPYSGWRGEFAWFGGIGPIGFIETSNVDDWWSNDWTITTTKDCVLPLVTAFDDYKAGDEFSFYFDGLKTAWSSTYADNLGYFHGEYDNLILTAGTHTLTFNVTALALGGELTEGSAHAEFSAASPYPAPEPATFILLSAGFGGLIYWRRKVRG